VSDNMLESRERETSEWYKWSLCVFPKLKGYKIDYTWCSFWSPWLDFVVLYDSQWTSLGDEHILIACSYLKTEFEMEDTD
jgi:hypothetical protein